MVYGDSLTPATSNLMWISNPAIKKFLYVSGEQVDILLNFIP